MSIALSTAFLALVIGLQTFWISRSLGRLETGQDTLAERLDGRIDSFQAEMHRDLTTHSEAIADLRERVARLETT